MMFYYYYLCRIQYRYIFRCVISTILLLLLLGLQAAQESVLKLVPIESRRRFYQRVFKWVVAFATWRYGEVRTRLREGNTHSSSNSGATSAVSPNPHRTPTKSSTMVSCYIYLTILLVSFTLLTYAYYTTYIHTGCVLCFFYWTEHITT